MPLWKITVKLFISPAHVAWKTCWTTPGGWWENLASGGFSPLRHNVVGVSHNCVEIVVSGYFYTDVDPPPPNTMSARCGLLCLEFVYVQSVAVQHNVVSSSNVRFYHPLPPHMWLNWTKARYATTLAQGEKTKQKQKLIILLGGHGGYFRQRLLAVVDSFKHGSQFDLVCLWSICWLYIL